MSDSVVSRWVATLVVALLLALGGRARATPERARRAFEMVDSVGVCTHWSYVDTTYGTEYERARDLLIDSGIRHVRDGRSERLYELAEHGIRATVVMEPRGATPMSELLAEIRQFDALGAPRPVEAVEGPNEPEVFWPAFHPDGYLGRGFPEGAIAFQRDLYTAVKGDPETRGWIVLGIALGTTLTPGNPSNPLGNAAELAPFVDWGNFHPYPQGNAFNLPSPYATIERYYWTSNFPSLPVEGFRDEVRPWFEYYRAPYGDRPMGATETGYPTHEAGLPERVVGKYLPRLFLEMFRVGIQRTFAYELLDERDRPEDAESSFGMIRSDLTPKPSYTAIRNLLRVLADGPEPFDPGTVDIELEVRPTTLPASTVRPDGAPDQDVVFDRLEYVRHLVLAKRNGARYVVLWHDISNADLSGPRPVELTPPDMPATLVVRTPFARAHVIRFDDAGELGHAPVDPAAPIVLGVPDRPLIVELLPPGIPSAVAAEVPREDDPDAGPAPGPDAGSDELAPDAGPGPDSPAIPSGCGCRVARGGAGGGLAALVLAVVLGAGCRARRRAARLSGRGTGS